MSMMPASLSSQGAALNQNIPTSSTGPKATVMDVPSSAINPGSSWSSTMANVQSAQKDDLTKTDFSGMFESDTSDSGDGTTVKANFDTTTGSSDNVGAGVSSAL